VSGDLLGRALLRLDPPLRVVARHVLAADSPLDAVACDPQGGAVAVLRAGPHEDRAALVDLLAHVAWLEPRLRDWQALAPSLPLVPETPARGLLLAPVFDGRTRRAAGAVKGRLQLGHWRAPPDSVGGEPWIELLEEAGAAPGPGGSQSLPHAPSRAGLASARFRTRLTDADLAPVLHREGAADPEAPPPGSEGQSVAPCGGDDFRRR